MSKMVSRSVYQKKAEEAKRLKTDLKRIVQQKPGYEKVVAYYRGFFESSDWLDDLLQDYARNHYKK